MLIVLFLAPFEYFSMQSIVKSSYYFTFTQLLQVLLNIIVRHACYISTTFSNLHNFDRLHCGRLLVIVHSGCILAK